MLKLDCIIPLHFPPLHWGKGRTKKPKQAPDVTSELFSEAKQCREAHLIHLTHKGEVEWLTETSCGLNRG